VTHTGGEEVEKRYEEVISNGVENKPKMSIT